MLALCAMLFIANVFNICEAKFLKYIPCKRLGTYVLENERGENNNHEVYLNTDSKGNNFLLIRTNCFYMQNQGYLVTTPGYAKSPKAAVEDILAYHIRRGTFGKHKIDYINLLIPYSKHFSEKLFEVYGVRTIIVDLPDVFVYAYIDGRFFVSDKQFTYDEARRFVSAL